MSFEGTVFFCLGQLLFALFLSTHLKGLSVNLKVAYPRTDNIGSDTCLIVEEGFANVTYISGLST